MNTITIDSNIYSEVEVFARLNNTTVADVVKESLQMFLKKINHSETIVPTAKFELPEHIKKMRGILAGVEDESDERLNYILERNK